MKLQLTIRHINLVLLVAMIMFIIAITISDLLTPGISIELLYTDGITFVFCSVLLWAAWKNWAYTSLCLVLFYIAMVGFSMPEPYLTQRISLTIFIPPILAMVLLSPVWIIISGVGSILILLGRAGWQGVYADTFNLLVYGMSLVGLVLGRSIANNATRIAESALFDLERSSHDLQQSKDTLEQRVLERTAEVQANLAELQEQARIQARLLSENEQQRQTIRNLSVPIIPVTRNELVMPLVGELDQERIEYVRSQALQALSHSKAQILVIDITGVPVVDTQVAQGLVAVAQAARLLGGRVILVGIRPEVAQTIVGLGITTEGIQTYADLQSALARK